MRVSDSVGWVWIVAARSSAVSAASTARAPSAISSPAPGPTIPTPDTRRLETQLRADGAAPDGDEHAVEGGGVPLAEARLDLRSLLVERRHLRAETDLHEELFAMARERLDEVAVHAGQEAVGHLDERHLAAERGVDLAELETDVASADDEEALGQIGELERPRRVHHAVARQRGTGQRAGRRARRDDGVLEADLLRLVALHAERAGVLEDP